MYPNARRPPRPRALLMPPGSWSGKSHPRGPPPCGTHTPRHLHRPGPPGPTTTPPWWRRALCLTRAEPGVAPRPGWPAPAHSGPSSRTRHHNPVGVPPRRVWPRPPPPPAASWRAGHTLPAHTRTVLSRWTCTRSWVRAGSNSPSGGGDGVEHPGPVVAGGPGWLRPHTGACSARGPAGSWGPSHIRGRQGTGAPVHGVGTIRAQAHASGHTRARPTPTPGPTTGTHRPSTPRPNRCSARTPPAGRAHTPGPGRQSSSGLAGVPTRPLRSPARPRQGQAQARRLQPLLALRWRDRHAAHRRRAEPRRRLDPRPPHTALTRWLRTGSREPPRGAPPMQLRARQPRGQRTGPAGEQPQLVTANASPQATRHGGTRAGTHCHAPHTAPL